MGTGQRSQSWRGPRTPYGKLQEPLGKTPEGRLHRALSLRQGPKKPRSQGLDGGTEGSDAPSQEQVQGSLEDNEQLIQAQRGGSRRWLRQYQQVRRRWQNFVSSFPSVTLSRPAPPEPPLGTTS
ncbi:uncharacterized protein C11orf86 homolog [Dasypus novemcinctus]|uniref:uncharacterized protein C11orf86 homolog n=1 Tax=Dasypus novemcinctus TaxID=9361 RepID=UPI000328DB5E|nr:uncharacterized protein C11orf86 homolog [Dasypus novemcinctus]